MHDLDDARSPTEDLDELRRAVNESLPRLEACVARGDPPMREAVTYHVAVDAAGTIRRELQTKPPPSKPVQRPTCTEYDAHMGRCERVEQPSPPPQAPDVSPKTLDCLSEALDHLGLRPPRRGPFSARVTIEPR